MKDSARTTAKVLFNNASWSFIAQGLTRGGMVLSGVFWAHYLTIEEYGDYSYFVILITTLGACLAAGLPLVTTKVFAEHSDSNTVLLRHQWKQILKFQVALFLMVLGAILIPVPFIEAIRIKYGALLVVGVSGLAAIGLTSSGALVGLQMYRTLAVTALVALLALIATTISFRSNGDALLAAKILFFYMVVRALLQLLAINRALKLRTQTSKSYSGPTTVLIRTSWVTGAIAIASSVSPTLIASSQALKESSESVALFLIGYQWYALVLLFPTQFGIALLPLLARATDASGKSSEAKRTLVTSMILSGFSGFLIAAATIVITPVLLPVYGDSYGGQWKYVATFLAIAPLSAVNNVIYSFYVARDMLLGWLVGSIFWLSSLAALLWILTDWGKWAAPFSLGICEGLRCICLIGLMRRRGDL